MSTPCACANCNWTGDIDDADETRNFWSRVLPGDEMPAGECPDCEALVYIVKENEALKNALAVLADIAAYPKAGEPTPDAPDGRQVWDQASGKYAIQALHDIIDKARGAIPAEPAPVPPTGYAVLAAGDELCDLMRNAEEAHIYDYQNGNEQPQDCVFKLAREAWRAARARQEAFKVLTTTDWAIIKVLLAGHTDYVDVTNAVANAANCQPDDVRGLLIQFGVLKQSDPSPHQAGDDHPKSRTTCTLSASEGRPRGSHL